MIHTSVNPLFDMQSTPAPARPVTELGALPFGDVLSREIGVREQNPAVAPTRAAPARTNGKSDVTQQAQQGLQRQAARASEAHVQVRQNAQQAQQAEALQRNHNAQQQQDAKRSNSTDDTSRGTSTERMQVPEPTNGDSSSTSKTKAESAVTATDAAGKTIASADAPRGPDPAAPNVSVDSVTSQVSFPVGLDMTHQLSGNAVLDPIAANDKTGALGTRADRSINAAADKPDLALDALLAQAGQLTQQRDGAAGAGAKFASSAPDVTPVTLASTDPGGTRVAPLVTGTGLATVGLAKTVSDIAVENTVLPLTKDVVLGATPGLPANNGSLASALQTTTSAAANVLTPHVGTTAWDNALGQKIVWMAAGAEQTASLTLNPPDLGPLQVVINVSNAHAEASFIAAQPEVRQALEAAMPKLKEMMADAGISLGQTSVNAGSPSQHGSGQHHQGASQANGGGGRVDNARAGVADGIGGNRARAISSGSSLVDIFA